MEFNVYATSLLVEIQRVLLRTFKLAVTLGKAKVTHFITVGIFIFIAYLIAPRSIFSL